MRMQRAEWAKRLSVPEVLTLAEAAEYLKVSERTLWAQAKAGIIPCFKVGSQYRFITEKLRQLGDGTAVV